MNKFTIIQILKTFSQTELKEFEKFLKSPYFGGSNYLISYFNAIKKYYPEFRSSFIKKEKIFKKLYPGKKFNDLTLRKLSSGLYDIAEKFLIQKGIEGSSELDKALLSELRSRRLFSLFEKKWRKLQEKFDKNNPFDYDFFIHMHFAEIENINYHSAKKMEIENFDNHQKFYEYLLNYSLNYIMSGPVNEFIYKNAYNLDEEKSLLKLFMNNFDFENFIDMAEDINYRHAEVFRLNFSMMEMFLKIEDHSKYFKYKNTLLIYVNNIGEDSRYFYLTKLINVCKFKIREGYPEFSKELFDVYKFMTDNEMLIEPNRRLISEFIFNDVVYYGLENGNLRWVNDFIESNIKLIIPDTREKTYHYSKGVLEFYNKNYEKSLEYFSVLKGDLSHSKFHIREYTLKNYYELSYFDPAEAMVDSLRHFLKSVKHLSEKMRNDYLLFIKFYNRLLTSKRDNKKENAVIILSDLSKETFPEKHWLIEKASELMKK
jgi:hypothetical protein